jgi:hypothetical protein
LLDGDLNQEMAHQEVGLLYAAIILKRWGGGHFKDIEIRGLEGDIKRVDKQNGPKNAVKILLARNRDN